jgi:hypothetical protein
MAARLRNTWWRACANQRPRYADEWGECSDRKDFPTKAEAREFCRRNGGGEIYKVRYRSENSTDKLTDNEEVPAA